MHRAPKIAARRYLIGGRVQGVGFRAFTERAASELGITGWARNLDDGRVEVHANGAPAHLEELEARLRQGPRWSEVRGFEVVEAEISSTSGFFIR